ncbi:MAG: SDR family NAD(P)-dependent oxidoreductase [Spirochaetia bacterium]
MRRLQGKTAYITGGSRGIGYAIAVELVQAGARVALLARSEDRLIEAEQRLVAMGEGVAVTHLSLDVSDRKAAERLLPELVDKFGGPDLLVNCHGATSVHYFTETSHDDLIRLLDVNIGGAWNTIQLLLPELEKRRGTIANVASVAGFIGLIGYAAYSASKFGLVGLSEVLRNELKPRGVRVCVLCPPDTDTPMLRAQNVIKPFETKVMSESLPVKSAEYVARAFVRGLRSRRFLIVPGLMARLSLIVKGVAPGLIFGIVDSDLRKAQKKMGQTSGQGESRV